MGHAIISVSVTPKLVVIAANGNTRRSGIIHKTISRHTPMGTSMTINRSSGSATAAKPYNAATASCSAITMPRRRAEGATGARLYWGITNGSADVWAMTSYNRGRRTRESTK